MRRVFEYRSACCRSEACIVWGELVVTYAARNEEHWRRCSAFPLFAGQRVAGATGDLGQALRRRGHSVHRINFNGGDVAFWPMPGALDYLGDVSDWSGFLAKRLSEWSITDIVLLGDCRPLHRRAIKVAIALGVPVYVLRRGLYAAQLDHLGTRRRERALIAWPRSAMVPRSRK